MFGPNAKDGSAGKISENPFARADLEHIHLMIDDDMRLEALKQTNYIKAIVTAKGKMDLERKGKQSYQGFMYARILAFSNGDLVSLYDRSDGFFRRQLILTTKRKPPDRIDDPNLSEKLCEEMEGILLWAMAGLLRLVKNNFQFTESGRAKLNREMVKKDANNIELFLESKGYIVRDPERSISSKDLYAVYCTWCDENAYPPMKRKTFVEYLSANEEKLGIHYTTHLTNSAGREVRGFRGIGSLSSARRVTCKADGRRSLLTTTRSKTHKATFAPNKASIRPDAKGRKTNSSVTITGRMDASKRGKSASVHYGFSQ